MKQYVDVSISSLFLICMIADTWRSNFYDGTSNRLASDFKEGRH